MTKSTNIASDDEVPKPIHDEDLQTRHDDLASQLGLIDEALANAGFVDVPSEADAVIVKHSSTLDRVALALLLLSSSQNIIKELQGAIEEAGIIHEGADNVIMGVREACARLKAAENALAEAITAKDDAQAQAQKAADALAKKPKAIKGVKPKTLRACGPEAAPEYPLGQQGKAEAIKRLIACAKTVELAFSDGKHELEDVLPIVISGEAWSVVNDRLLLRGVDLAIYGSSRDGAAFDLVGYGLFLDGGLVAYSPRINGPLSIAPGTSHSLNDDVVFS